MKEVLVLIPAFNEEESISDLIEELDRAGVRQLADILVVDDASYDRTGYISKKYGVHVVRHIFNLGYGSALQLGYKYAVRRGYKYVIQLDADGQHDVSNIFTIYDRLNKADDRGKYPDIVIGSRFLEGSVTFPISRIKKFAIVFFRWIINRATGKTITDPTSGLQGLNRRAFLYYSIFQYFNYTYPDANMIIQMLLLGFDIVEIPAVMYERKAGESMHGGIWRPIFYMMIMPLSILGVYLRIKAKIQIPAELWTSSEEKFENRGIKRPSD